MAVEITIVCDGCGKKAASYTDPTGALGMFPNPPPGWATLDVTAHAGHRASAGLYHYVLCPECRSRVSGAVVNAFGPDKAFPAI